MVLVEGEMSTPKEIQARGLSPKLYSLCTSYTPQQHIHIYHTLQMIPVYTSLVVQKQMSETPKRPRVDRVVV